MHTWHPRLGNNLHMPQNKFNPLAAEFFVLPTSWHGDNFFTYLRLEWSIFFHIYSLLLYFFSLALTSSGLRIKAPSLFTLQGKYTYTIFKAENQELNFRFMY